MRLAPGTNHFYPLKRAVLCSYAGVKAARSPKILNMEAQNCSFVLNIEV